MERLNPSKIYVDVDDAGAAALVVEVAGGRRFGVILEPESGTAPAKPAPEPPAAPAAPGG